jgi:release factor glutamine methyltransferase
VNETLRLILSRATEQLGSAGIPSARLDARILLAHALGIAADDVFLQDDIDAGQIRRFETNVARRMLREPLAYITGTKEFWSMAFDVGPGVLIPRPETETLIEEALREFPDPEAPLRVLDLGTGSGCLLIAFLRNFPNATGLGIDASPSALAYAQRNRVRHQLAHRCRLRRAAWSEPFEERFEAILANPPYLTDPECSTCEPEIRDNEPRKALSVAGDGLGALRELGPVFARHLSPSGRGFVEIGAGQAEDAAEILRGHGLEVARIAPDIAGIARCIVFGHLGAAGEDSKNQLERCPRPASFSGN